MTAGPQWCCHHSQRVTCILLSSNGMTVDNHQEPSSNKYQITLSPIEEWHMHWIIFYSCSSESCFYKHCITGWCNRNTVCLPLLTYTRINVRLNREYNANPAHPPALFSSPAEQQNLDFEPRKPFLWFSKRMQILNKTAINLLLWLPWLVAKHWAASGEMPWALCHSKEGNRVAVFVAPWRLTEFIRHELFWTQVHFFTCMLGFQSYRLNFVGHLETVLFNSSGKRFLSSTHPHLVNMLYTQAKMFLWIFLCSFISAFKKTVSPSSLFKKEDVH